MKELYRKKYLNSRKEIINKSLKDKSIFNKIINNKHIKDAELILVYVSLSDEVDTLDLISYLLKHKRVAVPKIEDNTMNFYYLNSILDLKVGHFKVLEPVNNQIVKIFRKCVSLTPGICYSLDGYRIGYGKGYYDKFYSKHKNIYKIGLCYKELILDNIPHNNFDVKVDEIISD